MFFGVTVLAMGQPHDWHGASEVTLNDKGNNDWSHTKTKRDKAWTRCIILGMWRISFWVYDDIDI